MRRDIEFVMQREDRTKYDVRVSPFGGKFKFQFKERGAAGWDYDRQPERADLAELLAIIQRRYVRNRSSIKDVAAVEKLLRDFASRQRA
ncbi:MAG: hypothetical protein LBK76_10915 [Verrucomicrobiales bacterium]|jgi:hypothetical protein|nr:hypothetical protein [Verrucomicrobiales bacterium]